MGSKGTTSIFATFLLYPPPIRSLLPPSPLPKDDVPLFLGQLISPRLQQVYEDVHIDSMPTPARSGAPPFTSTSDLPCAFPDGVQLGSKGGRHGLHVDGAEPRVRGRLRRARARGDHRPRYRPCYSPPRRPPPRPPRGRDVFRPMPRRPGPSPHGWRHTARRRHRRLHVRPCSPPPPPLTKTASTTNAPRRCRSGLPRGGPSRQGCC